MASTNNQHFIKIAVVIFLILFITSIPLAWISLSYTNYHGDLTRIAKQSELDFGWRTKQPAINISELRASPIDTADILVIGDSFSAGLIWQSNLVRENYKIATYHWNQNQLICKDFSKILNNAKFQGKTVIFEIVELGAEKRIKNSAECEESNILSSPITDLKIPEEQIDLSQSINLTGQFIAGAETLLNSMLINFSADYPKNHNKKNKRGKIYTLTDGCTFFSNKLCQFGLFYHQDYTQTALHINTIKDMKTISQRLSNYNVIWLIIPNKSSVYQRELPIDFWKSLENNQLGPDLLNNFKINKYNIKDLYKPNDTHLSTTGYLHLGKIVSEYIKK